MIRSIRQVMSVDDIMKKVEKITLDVQSATKVLADGKTAAIAYPIAGYNCNKQF